MVLDVRVLKGSGLKELCNWAVHLKPTLPLLLPYSIYPALISGMQETSFKWYFKLVKIGDRRHKN